MTDDDPLGGRAPYTTHPDYDHLDSSEEAIECPYCREEHPDPWEYFHHHGGNEEQDVECQRCGQTFRATREITVSYSAAPVDPEVPRSPFEVSLTFEQHNWMWLIYPSSLAADVIRTAIISWKKKTDDPFSVTLGEVGEYEVARADGVVFKSYQTLVSQGLRPGHTLTVQRRQKP